MTETKRRLRWKKNPAETGLARIGAGPRGSRLHDGEKEYASVNASRDVLKFSWTGWYWVAFEGVPYINTCKTPVETEAEAKAQAMAYIKEHLK